MSTCTECGAPLRFGELDGVRIPLDAHEAMRGENRYIFEAGTGRLAPVIAKADVLAFTDHRETCPGRQ